MSVCRVSGSRDSASSKPAIASSLSPVRIRISASWAQTRPRVSSLSSGFAIEVEALGDPGGRIARLGLGVGARRGDLGQEVGVVGDLRAARSRSRLPRA